MESPSPEVHRTPVEDAKHMNNGQNIHTPPASDMSSLGRKGDDDEDEDDDAAAAAAASSSELSDLDDQFEEKTRSTSDLVEPDRYEGGIPIFQPNMDQFRDFEKYMNAVNPYGMESGIVLIDPPSEWKAERKALDDMVKAIKVRNPITQEFHHNEYGIYTQRNMEKMRTYNLPQWKSLCEQSQYQPPARRGERRNKAGAQAGAKAVPLKRKSEPLPLPEGVRRKAGRPRVKPAKPEAGFGEVGPLAPPTPTSPDHDPVGTIKDEEIETLGVPPSKRRGRAARGRAHLKPGRQAKAATRKMSDRAGGEKATTVAARRLHNAADALGDEVDEEAFKDFDYRIHNHDEWTKERCEELEEKYWKSLSYTNPMYGADMPGSLFDDDTRCWNVAKLPNLLDILGSKIPGVNTAYLYLGMWRATFAWHLEDVDLYSINYIHFGAPKQWYSISQRDAPKFEKAMRSIYANEAKNCDQFLRHKTFLVSPSLLKNKYGVTVNRVVHREGQFVVTFPIGYHSGYNLGYNCAESVNFALESWLPYGKNAKKCRCEDDSVFIDVDWFVRRLNGEPTPEVEEWVEVTDDDDDCEGDNAPGLRNLPTPPGSDRGQHKPGKRKRSSTKDGGGKRTKKIKIRISRSAVPCCLCPNDFACDELLPTEDGRRAHRRCALYTPETYFDEVEGQEVIRGMAEISKARLDLRCNECRQKRGSCFQCSSAKCARAYHATCAAQAGVQVDVSDVAIWHEGVEYRDTGLDFRCKLHRSVKTAKPSSDLARDNYRHIEKDTKEFHAYVTGLKANDIVQYQSSSGDDIEAGVLVELVDEEEGILVLDLLPTRQRRYIEANTVLFVDAATSCLQRPSPNAREFPKHLRGQALSWEDTTNRKPSRLDPFCSGLDQSTAYRWEEFSSTTPPPNHHQRAVDLSPEGRLWYYLGSQSTESKAYYTGNPSKPTHDPASNFLQSVEPARRPLPCQPLAGRRPSLPAAYPGQCSTNPRMLPLSTTGIRPPLSANEQREQQKRDDYRRRRAIWVHSGAPIAPVQYPDPLSRDSNRTAVEPGCHLQATDNHSTTPISPVPGGDAVLERRRMVTTLEPSRTIGTSDESGAGTGSEAKGMKLPTPPQGIGVDAQAVERQREFQRRAYQQSLSSTQLSPHSPGVHAPLSRNHTSTHQVQYSGPGVEAVVGTESSSGIAQDGNTLSSSTKAAVSGWERPDPELISSSPKVKADNSQPISSPQKNSRVISFNHPHLLSTTPNPFSSSFAHPSSSSSLSSPSPKQNVMSSPKKSTPIDIPKLYQDNIARIADPAHDTGNEVNLGLMEISPGYGFPSAPATTPSATPEDKGDKASHCMAPPPVPCRSPHSSIAVTNDAVQDGDALDPIIKGKENGSVDSALNAVTALAKKATKAARAAQAVGNFDQTLSDILTEIKHREEQGQTKGPIQDKKLAYSIANAAFKSMPKSAGAKIDKTTSEVRMVDGKPMENVHAEGEKTGKTTLGNIVEKEVDGEGAVAKAADIIQSGDWVYLRQLPSHGEALALVTAVKTAKTTETDLDSEWVKVDVDSSSAGLAAGEKKPLCIKADRSHDHHPTYHPAGPSPLPPYNRALVNPGAVHTNNPDVTDTDHKLSASFHHTLPPNNSKSHQQEKAQVERGLSGVNHEY